jgi:hypothetical protein
MKVIHESARKWASDTDDKIFIVGPSARWEYRPHVLEWFNDHGIAPPGFQFVTGLLLSNRKRFIINFNDEEIAMLFKLKFL